MTNNYRKKILSTDQTIERTTLSELVGNEQYARKVLPFIKSEYFSDRTERTVVSTGDLNSEDYETVLQPNPSNPKDV